MMANKREHVSISRKIIFIIVSFFLQFNSYSDEHLKELLMKADFFKKAKISLSKVILPFSMKDGDSKTQRRQVYL